MEPTDATGTVSPEVEMARAIDDTGKPRLEKQLFIWHASMTLLSLPKSFFAPQVISDHRWTATLPIDGFSVCRELLDGLMGSID
jgi:hypothetical protein